MPKVIALIGMFCWGAYLAHLGHHAATKEFWILIVLTFVAWSNWETHV